MALEITEYSCVPLDGHPIIMGGPEGFWVILNGLGWPLMTFVGVLYLWVPLDDPGWPWVATGGSG